MKRSQHIYCECMYRRKESISNMQKTRIDVRDTNAFNQQISSQSERFDGKLDYGTQKSMGPGKVSVRFTNHRIQLGPSGFRPEKYKRFRGQCRIRGWYRAFLIFM